MIHSCTFKCGESGNQKTTISVKFEFPNPRHKMRKDADPIAQVPSADLASSTLDRLNLPAEFLYTRSVPKPAFKTTIKETRTLLRIFQLAMAIASFISLALSTVIVNYSYALLSVSGVNFMCLVSLSSMVCSLPTLLLIFTLVCLV